ncbi:hypothetical protein ABW21_db0208099 [Orbilia brochopaga]|nr:hypothetical protein ABW21_db0208099 [Drechslerella brochopaga]
MQGPRQRKYGTQTPFTLCHPSSNAATTSSGSGPFSKFVRFSSSCLGLLAPMITASPSSSRSALWCTDHLSAASASLIPCFLTAVRRISSASKYSSFQYRVR